MRWTVLSGVAAWLAAAGLLAACADGTSPANEQRVAMAPISFNEIAGWADDKHAEALVSFRRSCPKLTAGPDTKIATDGGFKTITPAEWKKICDSASAVKAGDDRAARAFFEENFRPLVVQVPGRFTGYFEPDMRGSKAPSRLFTVPVYRRPTDLTDKPYYTRAEIEQGVAQGQGAGGRLRAGSGGAVRGPGPGQRPHPARRGRHASISASTAPTTGPTRRSATC